MNNKGPGSHPGVTQVSPRWDPGDTRVTPRPSQGELGVAETFVVQSEVVVFRLEAGLLKTHWHSSTKAAFLNWWFVTQKLVSLFEKGFLEKI